MGKVVLFLDRENILLIDKIWRIFPESYSGVAPAGMCASLNRACDGSVSLSLIPHVSPEMRSISCFPADGHCVRMAQS
jgi:hypothetical protein